jgi:hypothetical protein
MFFKKKKGDKQEMKRMRKKLMESGIKSVKKGRLAKSTVIAAQGSKIKINHYFKKQ